MPHIVPRNTPSLRARVTPAQLNEREREREHGSTHLRDVGEVAFDTRACDWIEAGRWDCPGRMVPAPAKRADVS